MDETTVVEPKVLYSIVPRHKWVLLRKEVEGERVIKTGGVSDVIVPEREQARSFRGRVVDFDRAIDDLKVGDLVVFTAYVMEIEDIEDLTGDPNLVLVRDEEIYACCREIE